MENKQKQKKISIGVEDFKTLIDWNGYFVDKTLMIKDLIESNAKVTLFTRPRRFGKTLNQFMIRRFFEDEITEKNIRMYKMRLPKPRIPRTLPRMRQLRNSRGAAQRAASVGFAEDTAQAERTGACACIFG